MSIVRIIMAGAGVVSLLAAPACAESLKPLLEHSLPDGKSITVVEVGFPPGAGAASHRHGQAFVYAYVLQGAVRSQLVGEPARTYRTGESWYEPPGADHVVTQNMSSRKPARLLVVFVSKPGEPLKTSEPEQKAQNMSQLDTPRTPTNSTRQPAPQQMVNALYSAFGDNHSRAVHAKGIMATGSFEPSAEARSLTKAALFAPQSMPVLVRFSDFTGIPNIPDTVGDANPRGLALKFKLPDGSEADVVSHSFNGFPTATTDEFRQLLLAIGASGAGAQKPTRLDDFLSTHPIAKTFLTTQKPPAASYGTLNYFGVNSFALTAANGSKSFVRYRFVPRTGEAFVTAEDLPSKGPNYLQEELPRRLSNGPIIFDWYAQIANTGDAIADPSIAWPETRRLVKLGSVRIDQLVADAALVDKATMFQPLNVPDGIDSADPMLGIRQAAYPLSFEHRQ